MNTMIKRTVALLLVLAVFTVLAVGCGKEEPDPADTAVTTTTASTLPPTTTTTLNGQMNSGLNVREGPGSQYPSLGGVLPDEAVVIVGRVGDWYKIEFGDTYGYINAHYVSVDGQPNASQMQEDRPMATTTTMFEPINGTVVGETVKVYASPDASQEAMGEITKDANVTITDQQGDWYQIEYNGGIGYVQLGGVTKVTTTTTTATTAEGQTTTTGADGIPNTAVEDALD